VSNSTSLELIAAQSSGVYAGVTAHRPAQKCDGVSSNPKGLAILKRPVLSMCIRIEGGGGTKKN